MLLLEKFENSYFTYGAALLNAFIITKVILTGEAAHLGKELEFQATDLFGNLQGLCLRFLVFAFHIVENIVKRIIHGKDIASAFHEIRLDDLLARSVITFCTFIPFFGFRELGRVMGTGKFRAWFSAQGR